MATNRKEELTKEMMGLVAQMDDEQLQITLEALQEIIITGRLDQATKRATEYRERHAVEN